MVQLMPLPPHLSGFIKILIDLTFLVPAYPGCLGNVSVVLVTWFFQNVTFLKTPHPQSLAAYFSTLFVNKDAKHF